MGGTINEFITSGKQDPSSTALLDIGGRGLSYRRLREHVVCTVKTLNARGFRPNDRLALVMQNGPMMATAILSITSGFACVPLNPEYKENEFEQQLTSVRAKCILVQSGVGSAAREASSRLGLEVLELEPVESEVGAFRIRGTGGEPPAEPIWAGTEDVALMMHTSGTTSKPKLVALTNSIVSHSVGVIAERLQLAPADRSINVLPLYHVHGQTMVFTSVASGGSIVCAPGFDPERFFSWFEGLKPTWYSTVPTMHRAILDVAKANASVISNGRLRFVRSGSSALPVQLIRELEEALRVPVIEAYGMTEASHGISSNLLPPGKRRAGSVGVPYKEEEVAILGEDGRLLGEGEVGEILIRGKNVITGYVNNPEANAASFTGGWLKTGDLGYLDADGYLFIAGRKKDVINRGGEKISPREVEEALMEDGAVSQAIVFPVQHPTLGEDLMAAVVLRKGHSVEEGALRAGLAGRVARHKVPQRIVVVDKIPQGPTGKPQRWEMAKILKAGSGGQAGAAVKDVSVIEAKIQRIWAEVLKRDAIGLDERFLEAGGDSLRVTQIASRLRAEFGVELDLETLFDADTISRQAKLLESSLLEKEGRMRKHQ